MQDGDHEPALKILGYGPLYCCLCRMTLFHCSSYHFSSSFAISSFLALLLGMDYFLINCVVFLYAISLADAVLRTYLKIFSDALLILRFVVWIFRDFLIVLDNWHWEVIVQRRYFHPVKA